MQKLLKIFMVGLVLQASVPSVATAQTRSQTDAAIAVCAAQREPIVKLRDRYRQTINEAMLRGAAIGALAGAGLGAAVTSGNKDGKGQGKAAIIGAVLGGIAGGVDQYIAAKRQITEDNRQIARMIDADARSYVGNVTAIATAINAVGKCRERQIETWEQRLVATRTEAVKRQEARNARLTAAVDPATRKTIERENKKEAEGDAKILKSMGTESAATQAAINDDKKLFDEILKFFDQDIMKMAEAQAMVEATSTASIRGSADAYVAEVIPPALMANTGNLGSSQSAFGNSGSAFGSSAPAPAPTQTAALPPADANGVPPWRAQVRTSGSINPKNGHQQVLMAQRDASAAASAVTQTSTARLQYANMKGNEIPANIS